MNNGLLVFDVSDVLANVLLAATSAAPEATKIICNQCDEAKPITGSQIEIAKALYFILLRAIQRFHTAAGKQKQIHITVNCVRRAETIHLEIFRNSNPTDWTLESQTNFDTEIVHAALIIQSNGGQLREEVDSSLMLRGFSIELPCAVCASHSVNEQKFDEELALA